MRAATEGSLPPVMPQGNLVEVLGREVRQGSPGELMVESSPSRQRRPPCKMNKEMSDEAADAAALIYLLTPKAAGWGRVPTGPSKGAPCPYPQRESRVVRSHELHHKGSGFKAVFPLAPLPRRPCMQESPCSLGAGVDFSNHQFTRQTDRGQDT